HFRAISNELSSPKVIYCNADSRGPKASTWDYNTAVAGYLNSHKQITYFTGYEADESRPQTILSGDYNVTGGAGGMPAGALAMTALNSGVTPGGTPRAITWTLATADPGNASYTGTIHKDQGN